MLSMASPLYHVSAQHLEAQGTKEPRSLLLQLLLEPFSHPGIMLDREVSMRCADCAEPLRVSGHWHAAMSRSSFPSSLGRIMPICASALAHPLL